MEDGWMDRFLAAMRLICWDVAMSGYGRESGWEGGGSWKQYGMRRRPAGVQGGAMRCGMRGWELGLGTARGAAGSLGAAMGTLPAAVGTWNFARVESRQTDEIGRREVVRALAERAAQEKKKFSAGESML